MWDGEEVPVWVTPFGMDYWNPYWPFELMGERSERGLDEVPRRDCAEVVATILV